MPNCKERNNPRRQGYTRPSGDLEAYKAIESIYCPPRTHIKGFRSKSPGRARYFSEMIRRGVFAVIKPSAIRSAEVVKKIKTVLLQNLREKQVQRQDASTSTSVASSDLNSTATTSINYYVKSRATTLKVGHGGTLDQLAEGVLVIGIGQDCKRLTQFLKGDKCYVASGELGKSTDSCDAGGIVTGQKAYNHIRRVDLEGTLESFKGEIFQTPPIYSALKHHGMRFSDLARSGILIEPQPRRITIYSISLLDFQPPYFKISVSCSSGTYIRSLIRDIGLQLGTVAHMTQLLRTKQGMFTLDVALPESQWTTDDIQRAIDRSSRMC